MFSGRGALLSRRTGKRRRAKRETMRTGQLKSEDWLHCDKLVVQNASQIATEEAIRGGGRIRSELRTVAVRLSRMLTVFGLLRVVLPGVAALSSQQDRGAPIITILTVFGLLGVILPGVAAQGRGAPIITILTVFGLLGVILPGVAAQGRGAPIITILTVFGLLGVILPGVAAQGRGAPIITILTVFGLLGVILPGVAAQGRGAPIITILTVFGLLGVILPGVAAQGRGAPIITIPQGSLQGVREYVDPRQRPVFAYKGIPYATPPVGRLRFKPPERGYGWNRTQLFDRFGPACPQLDVQGVPEPGVSEDCLTLNVWIPQSPDGFRRFPVVVFLDGELFWRQRASRFPMEELSSEELVTVSISYRTNLFGFLTLQSGAAPGNLGLRDQQLALRWVRDNIGAFGGDSRRVTLVGFSAGAASAGHHLVSPRSRGLFQRAMLVSGSPLATWAHMDSREARGFGQEVAAIMGCRNSNDNEMVRCLQDQDVMRLLTAAQRILESRGRFHPVFAPVTDSFLATPDRVLPEDPEQLLRRGDFAKLPVMAGIDEDDGLLMLYQYPGTDRLTFSNLTHVLRRVLFPRLLQQRHLKQQRHLLEGVLSYRYVDSVPPGSQQLMLASFVKIFSDAYFVAPLYSFLELYTRSGAVVYAYSYTGKGPDIFGNVVSLQGAGHGSELLYLFGPTMYRTVVGGTYGPAQQRLGQKLRAYWKGFITEGDPVRGRYGEQWERYTLDRPVFQDLVHSVSEVGYRREDAGFWNTFLGFIESAGITADPSQATTPQPLVGSEPPYEAIMWALLVIIVILILGLLVAFLLTRRRRRHKSDMAYG